MLYCEIVAGNFNGQVGCVMDLYTNNPSPPNPQVTFDNGETVYNLCWGDGVRIGSREMVTYSLYSFVLLSSTVDDTLNNDFFALHIPASSREFGVVKLSDSITSTLGASNGQTAATPYAVNWAYKQTLGLHVSCYYDPTTGYINNDMEVSDSVPWQISVPTNSVSQLVKVTAGFTCGNSTGVRMIIKRGDTTLMTVYGNTQSNNQPVSVSKSIAFTTNGVPITIKAEFSTETGVIDPWLFVETF